MKILCENLNFSYEQVPVLKNLNLAVQQGEHVWIRGRSGSGKSSLLKLIAGLLLFEKGLIQVGSVRYNSSSAQQSQLLRQESIGYVHQENHLIEHWTVLQNLNLVTSDQYQIERFFQSIGLTRIFFEKKVSELSGGEKQRISVIRMLLQKPKLALLDEPTAHLDDTNTEAILKLIQQELKDATLIIVSHDARLEKLALKQIQINEINA